MIHRCVEQLVIIAAQSVAEKQRNTIVRERRAVSNPSGRLPFGCQRNVLEGAV
jgi:hypothetical protein